MLHQIVSCKNMYMSLTSNKVSFCLKWFCLGWGVVVTESILKDSFLVQYNGNLNKKKNMQAAEKLYEAKKLGSYVYDFLHNGTAFW